MQPLRDLVVIEMKEKEEAKKNTILYAAPKWPKPQNVGIIIAIGPDTSNLKVGDECIINPYAVTDTQEERIKLIREKDILCKVK